MPNHSTDIDWAAAIDLLRRTDDLEADLHAEIAGRLLTGTERAIADVGCGAGGMTAALARTVAGMSGAGDTRIVGVDGNAALLAETGRRVAAGAALRQAGSRRVEVDLRQGDLSLSVPLPSGGIDLIWASAVVHHLPDQQQAVGDLVEKLSPGGRLALAEGGLRPRSLPWDLGVGEPGLEFRLDLAQDRWFAAMRSDLPGAVPMPYGWSEVLRLAGLQEVTARSFLQDLPAPLPDAAADLLLQRLRGFLDRDGLREQIDPEDEQTLHRLTDPADPLAQRVHPEMYLLGARTVHVGRRPL